MRDSESRDDRACRWAFKKTYGCKPSPDELRDYRRALAERDRLGLRDARPIYARLRAEAALAAAGAERRRNTRRGRPRRLRQAQALLREQLADGPKPAAEIEAAAEAAAISVHALLSAADALDVRTQRGQWWMRR